MSRRRLPAVVLTIATLTFATAVSAAEPAKDPLAVFDKSNLVAWCIVPFDAAKRGPAERAEMLVRLGVKRVAYDWRDEHVATFEEEIRQYEKHGLEYFAFWSWHPAMQPLIEKHGIHPQLWITNPSPAAATQEEKVEAAAKQLLPLAQQAAKLKCKIGLYNHGGWGGEPRNLVAVCQRLQQKKLDNVGIIYNWHHGHDHIADFAEMLALMKPHLLCLNLNGMNDGANPKILSLGQGKHDLAMLRVVRDSGYQGPLGVIGHRAERDVEECLRENLDGLERLVGELRQDK